MIDDFIDDIGRRLVMPARKRRRITLDVRDHLDDAVAQLTAQGVARSTAERRAIAAFGTAPALANELNAQVAATAFRRAPLAMAACGTAVVGGFLLAALTQPSPPAAVPAHLARQIAFFAAVLGLQFAFVAGARAVIRVGARWRVNPSTADFRLIRNAEMVFVAGLAVAAGGWTVALVDAFARNTDAHLPQLVAGEVLMVGPSMVACFVVARRRLPPIDDTLIRADATHGSVFELAERGIESAARQPLWCGGIAVAAAASAMSHAETTVRGALVWGAVQAIAVVTGFVVLGRVLELRGQRSATPLAG